ncbi:MAG: DUF2279 domain-containing protein [Bacteroidales bacterium]|nr:DUF2279 domain-containing protein [Bacteroidales bacterium]
MNNIFKNILTLLLFVIICNLSYSQTEKDSLNKKRLITAISLETGTYAISIVGLNQIWYKDYAKSSFHWFNDSDEWLQMDKAGHFFTSYYFNEILSAGFRWSGMERKKAVIPGSIMAFLFIGTIELMDGFSEKWGASWTDLTANTLGITLYGFQELCWQEQRILPKYSFSKSGYAAYRPDALGKNRLEQFIKDYNGQTQWLSVNIKSFIKTESFPSWINIAFGYSANGMVSGTDERDYEVYQGPYFDRYRQFLLSPDIDFSRIPTKSKFLKTVFNIGKFIKLPFPALEFSQRKLKGHWGYF